MKTFASFSFFIFIFATPLFSQENNEEPISCVKISDAFMKFGFYVENSVNGNLNDFQKLSSGSDLLPNNFDDYSTSDWSSTGGSMFSLAMSLKFRNKDRSGYRPNPLLRIGIKHFTSNTLSSRYSKEIRTRFDTLTSANSGNVTYLDSVNSTNYNIDYTSDHIHLDISLIFMTNPDKRWSVYGGLGLSAGIFYNANTQIVKSNYNSVEFEYKDIVASTPNYHYDHDDIIYENHRNNSGFSSSVYVPLGVDFRLGNKSEFWSKIHLYYEIQPAINITNIPELETIITGRTNHGIGLRVNW